MEKQRAHNVTNRKTITGPILVVDDDQNLRQTIQWVLEDEGHLVETAADGQEAVEQAAHQQPTLVILDMGLPILNGAEVAAELRSLYGTAVPIMLITADGHVMEKREQVGAYAALRKPFEINDLVQAVQQALSDQ